MPERAWLLALALAGCSAAVEDGSSSGNPLLVHDTRSPQVLNPQGVFIPDPAPQAERELLPELAFLELSAGLPPSGTWSGRPLLHDFTGDGRADLVAANCEELGYRAWQAPGPSETLWQPRNEGLTPDLGCSVACAIDVDRDGRADLALSSFASGVRVFLNDGRMNWREASGLAETPPVGDLAQGERDLVGVGYPRGGLLVLRGDECKVLAEEEFGRALALADLDLDGHDDLVVATGRRVRVFLSVPGSPPSWREQSAGLPAPARPDSLRALCVGHFHGQGRPQIAVCSQPDPALPESERDSIGVFGWDEARGAWVHVDEGLPRGDSFADLAAADFDSDGKLDLAVLSLEHGAAIYLGDGQGGFRAKGRLAGAHGRGRLAVGDIDGDGRPDLVLAVPAAQDGPEGGGVRAFLNQPAIWVAR
jgi:hypothetical protein